MKQYILLCFFFWGVKSVNAETGSFFVGGDYNNYYPVTFYDGNWENNITTILQIGRSDVHTDGTWHGSFISTIKYHVSNYGHHAEFINVEQFNSYAQFIAGWKDVSFLNGGKRIVVWLKGNSTYYFTGNTQIVPVIYDGVQNTLPFHEGNGPDHTFKTTIDNYANIYGASLGNDLIIQGSVGIGTMAASDKLSVNGNIRSKKIIVTQTGWPDYVFDSAYTLTPLAHVEQFIKDNKHLPDVPSAKEVRDNGLDVGDNQAVLLKKIEELTLYMIEMKKENEMMKKQMKQSKESFNPANSGSDKIKELMLYMIEMKKENENLKNKNQQLESRIEKIENKK
ncbi:hypothetical protein ACI6Q2_23180 [Chitinophagaceae bacterium LWZ2-11]